MGCRQDMAKAIGGPKRESKTFGETITVYFVMVSPLYLRKFNLGESSGEQVYGSKR